MDRVHQRTGDGVWWTGSVKLESFLTRPTAERCLHSSAPQRALHLFLVYPADVVNDSGGTLSRLPAATPRVTPLLRPLPVTQAVLSAGLASCLAQYFL